MRTFLKPQLLKCQMLPGEHGELQTYEMWNGSYDACWKPEHLIMTDVAPWGAAGEGDFPLSGAPWAWKTRVNHELYWVNLKRFQLWKEAWLYWVVCDWADMLMGCLKWEHEYTGVKKRFKNTVIKALLIFDQWNVWHRAAVRIVPHVFREYRLCLV